jgi:hypothetical protein
LGLVRTIGTQRAGDVGALVWVAEQLDLIGLIDRACGQEGPEDGPTIGEMVVAVAVQRACAPGAKRHLAAFLESCLPRVSCLPAAAFTGQVFHRLAAAVSEEQLEKAQIEIARAAGSASIYRRACWRSTRLTSTHTSRPPPPENWRAGAMPKANEAISA